jgi:transcriptional regulator with XRE-family HTH domain
MTNESGATEPTPSDVVAERVREIRRHRNLSVQELAQACADAGYPELTRDAIYAIETGRRVKGRRRRHVSVDELLAFTKVFNVPLSVLLWPIVSPPGGEVSTLVFDSPAERAGFLEMVNKLIVQVHGIGAEQDAMKPAKLKEQ